LECSKAILEARIHRPFARPFAESAREGVGHSHSHPAFAETLHAGVVANGALVAAALGAEVLARAVATYARLVADVGLLGLLRIDDAYGEADGGQRRQKQGAIL